MCTIPLSIQCIVPVGRYVTGILMDLQETRAFGLRYLGPEARINLESP